MMTATVIIALLAAVLASALAVKLYDEANKLEKAIKAHFEMKHAPFGISGVKVDQVDIILWEETGFKKVGE